MTRIAPTGHGRNTPTIRVNNKICTKAPESFPRRFSMEFIKIWKEKGHKKMKIHVFKILLKNGEKITRAEWGRTRKSAARTIWGIYGDNILALA